ncbi:MAG: phosphotransferase family protein [Pacificimonas sp.]
MIDLDDIRWRLRRYLGERWNTAVDVSGLKQFHGGAGRETFRFDATANGDTCGLVLRRDPAKSIIETDRRVEYDMLALVHGSNVPVPEPLFLEESAEAFGAPGFIMREVPDADAGDPGPDPFGDAREPLGEAFFKNLGELHRIDPAPLDIPASVPADRIDHWAAVIAEDKQDPEPVASAAERWLRANVPPPSARTTIVHGDYRRGNFLRRGHEIAAILDWEMAHVGDPLEDLAWATDPLWAFGADMPGSLISEPKAIAIWEAASGLTCDPVAYRWWRMFAQYMGLAIWISSAAEVASGRTGDPTIAFAAMYPYRFHQAALARSLRDMRK